MHALLPDETRVSQVRLRGRNKEELRRFYQELLGLEPVEENQNAVGFSAQRGHRPFIVVEEDPKAPANSGRTAGLFHLAVRYPTRRALAEAFLRLEKRGYPLEGASDHLVSEAIYLRDPEHNGVELYADRPRAEWTWRRGEIVMATKPLDLDSLVSAAKSPAGIARGADLGHLHLRVADLAKAERFYSDLVGLAVTTRSYAGALFFSAGGYHHHIAVNTWGSPAPALSESAA